MTAPHDSLRLFQQQVGIWGDATFPGSTTDTVLSHLTEELLELRGVPKHILPDVMAVIEAYENRVPLSNDAEEAADVLILLLHFCHKLGYDLMAHAWEKMLINRDRHWSKTAEAVGGHFKHVGENGR
jgi:NTP pyrophosphatase (non-canonical NTP hydrolase)